jgi:hypothetical protein
MREPRPLAAPLGLHGLLQGSFTFTMNEWLYKVRPTVERRRKGEVGNQGPLAYTVQAGAMLWSESSRCPWNAEGYVSLNQQQNAHQLPRVLLTWGQNKKKCKYVLVLN